MLVSTPRQQVKNGIRHINMLVGTSGFPKTMKKNWECWYAQQNFSRQIKFMGNRIRHTWILADYDKRHGNVGRYT